jgi:hypothetical protein
VGEQDDLARFCTDLGPLRALLRGPAGAAARALVEQVVEAARRGEPVAAQIAQIALLDVAGVLSYDDEPVFRGPPPRLSDLALPPVTGGYVCPMGACSRVESRRPGSPVPRCGVHQQALRFRTDAEPAR